MENLENRIDNFYHELLYVNAVIKILKSMDCDVRWEALYEVSGAYFKIIKISLLYSFIISMANLFEIRKSTKSKYFLFIDKFREKNDLELNEIIKSYEDEVNNKQALIDNILVWRDKYIAHIDLKFYFDKSKLANNPLSYDELQEFILLSIEYFSKITGIPVFLDFINADDFERLLEKFKSIGKH